MHVLVSTMGPGGQEHYRIAEPARAVNDADLGVTVTVQKGLETTMVRAPGGDGLVVGRVDSRGADVVVIQMPLTKEMLQCVRVLRAQGVAVVVEVDDMLTAVSLGNPGYGMLVGAGMGRWVMECCREADFVTVSTPALLREYASHGRGMVVPNAVPRRTAELPPAYEREPGTVTIGWSGSALGRPQDLRVVGSGLQQALDRTSGRSRFMVLGQAEGGREALGLRDEPLETWWKHDVDAYLLALGELFDVGIAPVRDDRFNSGKSWLKVLEYAARGIYAVHAPNPEYDRLRIGRRARNARDWARHISLGVEDPDQRRELAAEQHRQVLAGHLTEHTAPLWATAWRQARENRTRSMRIGA